MSLKIEIGPTSQTAIELPIDYSSTFGKKQIKSQHRTLAGNLYIYKHSDFTKHQFKIDLLSAQNASIVNSWWDTNTELLLFITSDTITEVHNVMILNKETPLNKFFKPYQNYYGGRLNLESY